MTKRIMVDKTAIGGGAPLVLIAGPCVIESRDLVMETADRLVKICAEADLALIFKSSYDKANRSSLSSFRGPGLKKGLEVLGEVKEKYGVPVLSDVHSPEEIGPASEVLDILQIPAFLCRQTDFVLQVAEAGRPVNVKKGQFMAPGDMKNVVDKIRSVGNENIILTERGSSFGYNNLVVDMRALPAMRKLQVPVVFDGTHSAQLPGGLGTASGGQREFVPFLTRAAVAAGVDGIFLEVHPDPDAGLCDGPNMLALKDLPLLLREVRAIDRVVKAAAE